MDDNQLLLILLPTLAVLLLILIVLILFLIRLHHRYLQLAHFNQQMDRHTFEGDEDNFKSDLMFYYTRREMEDYLPVYKEKDEPETVVSAPPPSYEGESRTVSKDANLASFML
jgi:hypothetical protein